MDNFNLGYIRLGGVGWGGGSNYLIYHVEKKTLYQVFQVHNNKAKFTIKHLKFALFTIEHCKNTLLLKGTIKNGS